MLNNFLNEINFIWQTPAGRIQMVVSLVIYVCVFLIFYAIANNFITAQGDKTVEKEKKNIVETGTMIAFFVVFYLLIRFQIGGVEIPVGPISLIAIIIGLLFIVLGTIVNLVGRKNLGNNWSNQIKIYKNHTFVHSGVYKIVRHPLYASLIWMFFGASIIYSNWAAFLANLLIFIPFMTYRAKEEEKVLSQKFDNYKEYQKNVGMFFPRIGTKYEID